MVFTRYSGFLHQQHWPSRFNWNIVESAIKHHNTNANPNPNRNTSIFMTWGTTVLIFMTWGTTVLIFMTWGTTVLIFMTWGSTVLIFMTRGTTVLSLYLYFPHQSLWHGVQRFYHCTCIFHINLYDMGYNGSIIVLVFSTSIFMTWGTTVLIFMTWGTTVLIFMTWGTTVLSLFLYFPHQSLWHGVQRFYHCSCIFHINLYDMGYNGSIIVLVFSTSIFMTWGTTILSLFLYFPHQSLWHGVQRFYHCACIFHINLYDMGYNVLSLYLYFPHHMTI